MADEIASGKEWLQEQDRSTEWGVPFTYEGIEQSNEPMWSAQIPRRTWQSRITITPEMIQDSTNRTPGEAFRNAMQAEWRAAIEGMQRDLMNHAFYIDGQQWVSWEGVTIDPDMEMDIGL